MRRHWTVRAKELIEIKSDVCQYPPTERWDWYLANIVPNLFECLEIALKEQENHEELVGMLEERIQELKEGWSPQ